MEVLRRRKKELEYQYSLCWVNMASARLNLQCPWIIKWWVILINVYVEVLINKCQPCPQALLGTRSAWGRGYSNAGQDWCQTHSLRVLLFTYVPSFLVVLWAADWLPVGDHSYKWQGDSRRETLQLKELRERHSWWNLQSTQNGETDHSVEDGGTNTYYDNGNFE